MTDAHLVFAADDVEEALLPPGLYPSTISRARLRTSGNGNRMIHVVHALDGVAAGCARLADYFVLEGAAAHVLALTRRRLVQLYRAAGLEPKAGDEIAPEALVGATLHIRLEIERWRGRARLRVTEYRPRAADDDLPF